MLVSEIMQLSTGCRQKNTLLLADIWLANNELGNFRHTQLHTIILSQVHEQIQKL